jgi:hypothetical protein
VRWLIPEEMKMPANKMRAITSTTSMVLLRLVNTNRGNSS